MTQEEKAKAYDEALAKAREFYDSPRTCFIIDQLCEMFPSLTESEDERIIHCLEEIIDWGCSKNIAVECGVDLKAVKSWLEKQKERGPLTKEEEYTLYRIIEYFEDEDEHPEWVELLRNIYNLPYVKQKEQKPEEIWPNLSNCIHNCKNCLARCLYRKEENPEQKPAEYPMTPSECYKPAEWSEENEENRLAINKAIWEYDEFSQGDAIKLINWLKSLRPHWKPSEEQMLNLRYIISGCSYDIEPIVELEKQLKKLI